MRSIFLTCFVFVAAVSAAQQVEPLVFQEKIHDFGSIQEEEGNADYEFTFVNNSGRTIRIISVQPSCGCTTPGWTNEPIGPGKTGSIKASFNPIGRPGYFNKTLAVTTDLNGSPILLQIKGNVVTKSIETDISRLSASSGNLLLKSTSFNLGKMYINQPASPVEFKIHNQGENPLNIQSVISPPYLKVIVANSIGPNETTRIQLLFDAKLKGQYGFISEAIELLTDDEKMPRKLFSVYATVEEFFPTLSEEEKKKAPRLVVEKNQMDIGVVKLGATIRRELPLKNTGKQTLLIRSLQPNCSCVVSSLNSMEIKPGQSAILTIEMTGQGRQGTQNKAITIYSNDPVNPVQRIALVAVVN